MKLLTDSGKEQITQAINEAEKVTSCEIVVTEVAACDDYNSARFIWGILCLFIAYIIAYYFTPLDGIWLLVSQAGGFIIGFFVFGNIPAMKRLFIPSRKMDSETHYRALSEFYQQGLYKTRQENGILLMLAVFERRVIVLGDRGVNAKVNQAYWDGIRDQIIGAIKQGSAGLAITEAIKSMANDLKTHFPYQPDDRNELPDDVSVSR